MSSACSLRPAGLPLPIEKSLLRRLNQSVLGNAAFLAEAVADRNKLTINVMAACLQIEDAGAQAFFEAMRAFIETHSLGQKGVKIEADDVYVDLDNPITQES